MGRITSKEITAHSKLIHPKITNWVFIPFHFRQTNRMKKFQRALGKLKYELTDVKKFQVALEQAEKQRKNIESL